jgi:hypothetical protein
MATSLKARPVEQFGDEGLRPDLHQRHDRRMVEGGVGLLAQVLQDVGGDLLAGELADDRGRHLGIGLAGETRNLLGRDRRPFLGDIKAAVRRQALQHGVDETDGGRGAPRRDELH